MKDEEIKTENFKENYDNNELDNEEIVDDITFVESTEDGDALPSKDIVKKLREELRVCRKEKEEYLTGWQRAKADYVNLQKDIDSSRLSNALLVKERFMRNLLGALDSFDMAFTNKEAWEKVDKNWRMGVEYIHQQLINGLIDSGVEKIDQIGVVFNPSIHESIESIETEDELKDHTVEKVILVGYKIGDRVVRPARVNIYEYKK